MAEIEDVDVDPTIPKDRGIGIKFTDSNKNQFVTVYNDEFPRPAVLDITSWRGISAGAIHYYGEIQIRGLMQELVKVGKKDDPFFKKGHTYGMSDCPEEAQSFHIQVTRPVTQTDLDMDGGRAFECYNIGDPTHRFETEEELIAAAKKSFKRIFGSGWKLVLKVPVKKQDEKGDYWEDKDKILAKT